MARRLILDTGVIVSAERRSGVLTAWMSGDDDTSLAAITVAELWHGIELADPKDRARREASVSRLVSSIAVVTYDAEVARAHARLLAHVQRIGAPRGAHDLMIAATAVVTGRTLVTTDARARFDELPGVDGVVLPIG